MANQRISELVQITVPEMVVGNLLLISDISAVQSKKLTLGDLQHFLVLNGILSGSFYGTASYAVNAATASFATQDSASYALTASLALNVVTASHALGGLTASYASTASYVATASYALTANIEIALSASFAGNAQTASYLYYDPTSNPNNGTASYALTASFIELANDSASYSITTSYTPYADTASQALSSNQADTASYVSTASYLQFNGVPNGTASYALFAQNTANVLQDYGSFNAITQSIYVAQLDMVSVTPTFGGQQITSFDVRGTLDVPFSSSNSANGKVELFVLDRESGNSQSIDYSPVFINIGPSSTVISGTMRFPFSLRGEASLYGLYEVYVTASYNEVYFDTSRKMKYRITSTSDQLSVQSAEPTIFYSYPNNANMLWSSSLHPGHAYQGSSSQVIFSGSYDVTDLVIPPNSVQNLFYTWTLTGLITMSVDNNPGLTSVGGIPTACVSMSAANCGLTQLPDMSTGSIGYLNVPNNNIVTDLLLPASMSYINIANNSYANLPFTLPQGLTVLIADGNGATSTPFTIPNTIQTMSFANCPNLTSYIASALPANLTYFNSNGSPLNSLPTVIPVNLYYVDVTNNNLSPSTIGSLVQGLVAPPIEYGGFLSIYGNAGSASAFNLAANIATLKSNGWTVIS